MAKDERRFYHYAEGVLGDRIATEDKSEAARKDIMHHLIQGKDSNTGERFTRKQLNVESSLLIAAGADTTSLTLAAIFFYLLRSPRVMRKLIKEIQSIYDSDDVGGISPSVLLGLPYLRAVVDETLRLAPPVPSHLPREVLRGGITIDGHFLPQGTIVGVSAYAIHRNPEYYPAPDSFYPERWIVDPKETSPPNSANIPRTQHAVSIARQAFVGFSQGSRGCIGRQLAYYELHTAVAVLLNHFDIRSAVDPHSREPLSDTTAWRKDFPSVMDTNAPRESLRYGRRRRDEFQLFDRFLSDRNGPMVQFKRRLR